MRKPVMQLSIAVYAVKHNQILPPSIHLYGWIDKQTELR
jgi:hypothetical protein